MFIKYLYNIHNIKNYQSIIKVGETEILLIGETHSTALLFKDNLTRNWVLSHIWTQLKKEKFLDLDSDVEIFHTSEKYKI